MTNSRSHMSLAVRVAVVSFLVAFSAAAAVHEHQAEADPSAFAARLKKILATTPEAERFDDDLFDNHLMREVITDPERFLPQIEAYLASGPGISRAEARLSLISVQCLALPDYLALLDRLSVVPGGRLSGWVLFYAINPGFESSTRMATSFKNKKVLDTLQRVARSANADQNSQDAIREIVDGTAYRYIKSEKIAPLLRCKKR